MNRVSSGLFGSVIALTLTFLGIEVGLRLSPGLIPEDLLKHFYDPLRSEIAQLRALPLESHARFVERDDNGPPLKVLKPFTSLRYDYRDTGESGTFVMDGLGFSNAPENDWRAEKHDIIVLGDSFTHPTPPHPELTWPARLGRMADRSLYVVSRSGTGPYEYVQLLKDVGLSKRPDVVIMQIYGGNDLRDSLLYHRWANATPDERMFIHKERSRVIVVDGYLDNALGRHSYAFNTVVVAAASAAEVMQAWLDGSSHVDFRYRAVFPTGTLKLNIENRDRDEVRMARRLRDGELSLTLYDQALDTFAALAREHGFVPILSYAPSAFSAYADVVEFHAPEIQRLMPWFCDSQRNHLRGKAEELGLTFVDLTPALRQAARELGPSDQLYRPISVHFARLGDQTVAKTLADVLATQAATRSTDR